MLYYSILAQESLSDELWVRKDGNLWPVYDYKIENDQIRLISSTESTIYEAVTLSELVEYVEEEGNCERVPYVIVDETSDNYLDIKDRFTEKLIFEVCN